MSDTPRTDAQEQCGFVYDANGEPIGNGVPAVSAKFARDLERENAELRRQLAEARDKALEDAAVAVENETCNCCEDLRAFSEHACQTIRQLKGKQS